MRLGAKRDDPEDDVNLTPLIDVVFLLLIFFMIATTFESQSQIVLEFPSPSKIAKKIAQNKDIVEITIDDKGNFYVNKQQLINSSAGALKRALKTAIANKKNIGALPVVISAHAKAKHQHVITAMYASREVGLINILFSTVKSSNK